MVATALIRRAAWAGLALAAAGFVGFMALHGERGEGGLDRFVAAGFLATSEARDVRRVVVDAGGRRAGYDRSPDGQWTTGSPPASVAADLAQRIEQALDLLRHAKPDRQFTAEEAASMPKDGLGLAPPVITVDVVINGRSSFTIAFGTENPLGHARYARVGDTLWLVPKHMADAWGSVVRQP